MRGEPDPERDPGQPEIVELGGVPGFVVFDLPGRPCPPAERGWRLM
ncbi:MAG TPA: hypothetical protein VMU94_17240 [Streptosporangiaceae bacterium]|nr:hypothetical protein [Streptosporangiaceae bacterium]